MKIVQANKFFFLKAGAEKYMFELSDWLVSQGHTVIPFSMQHPDNRPTPFDVYFPSYVQTERVRLSWQGMRTFGRLVYSFEARRKFASLLYDTKPDLCHLHSIYTQLSPSILDTLSDQRVPTVMTVHDHHLVSPQYNIWAQGCGEDYRDKGLLRAVRDRFHKDSFVASMTQAGVFALHRAFRMYEKNVRIFITPSQYMKRQLVRGGFEEERVRVNPYGVDTRAIEPCYESDGYFLFVGRLSEEKGIPTIIQTAKLLPDMNFKIVGHGPDMEYLHSLAHGMENIEFLGFRMGDELMDLYRRASGVLLPSRVHEVFPLILLEAMSVGKPVIASDVGGISEIVEDRVNGFLVKPTDLQGWAEAIMRMAYDEDLRLRLSRNARNTVEQRFRLEPHYERLMQIYREAIG